MGEQDDLLHYGILGVVILGVLWVIRAFAGQNPANSNVASADTDCGCVG